MRKLLLLFILFPVIVFSKNKIINGKAPDFEHPGKYNTVALVKAHNKKIFCSGSLISKRIILTAKHCLMDRNLEDVLVFFGDDTNLIENGVLYKPTRMKVRYPKDWQMSFPSFDIAWIELDKDAPAEYKALPIVSDRKELEGVKNIHLAGYGNSAVQDGKIISGEKFTTVTKLKSYYDNARFFHILLFEGEEGQGACHGDSGGPAYIRTKNGWAITGVTNGFDIVLTPKAMRRTGDTEFPYAIDCKKNQILYSFAGAHGDWIEKTAEQDVLKTTAFKSYDTDQSFEHESLKSWCEARDFASPRWNFLKIILDQQVDRLEQTKAASFYNDCSQIVEFLNELKSITINGEKTVDASFSLSPVHLLNLESLKILDFKIKYFDFNSTFPIDIQELVLNRVNLTNLNFLTHTNFTIKNLDLSNNLLSSLDGIEALKTLDSLSLNQTQVSDLKPLKEITSLAKLDIRKTNVTSLRGVEAHNLVELSLGSKFLNELTFENFSSLKKLKISYMDLKTLEFLEPLIKLEELDLSRTGINDLSVFSIVKFADLNTLNLSGNPIKSVQELNNLESLKSLNLFGTPINKKDFQLKPENCPTDGPGVLAEFCLGK